MSDGKPKVDEVRYTFAQSPDCCDDHDFAQSLIVKTQNGGGSHGDAYIVIETKRWALDGDGIDEFAAMLKRVLAEVTRQAEPTNA